MRSGSIPIFRRYWASLSLLEDKVNIDIVFIQSYVAFSKTLTLALSQKGRGNKKKLLHFSPCLLMVQ